MQTNNIFVMWCCKWSRQLPWNFYVTFISKLLNRVWWNKNHETHQNALRYRGIRLCCDVTDVNNTENCSQERWQHDLRLIWSKDKSPNVWFLFQWRHIFSWRSSDRAKYKHKVFCMEIACYLRKTHHYQLTKCLCVQFFGATTVATNLFIIIVQTNNL